ncbi:unnamed protein product [Cercopithifilaria johnstoni]|uniref:Uncharacterized protein n=1 Tax=Cercopithifilaria johnstoni TaxID=2874296 RepID=A0A8J2MF31_9BILA|nr:unnamed protein product [Cercopithifilaria johnstoni]
MKLHYAIGYQRSIPGPKMKLSKGRDFIVISGNNQLLFYGSEDYDETVTVNVICLAELTEHVGIDPLDEKIQKFSFDTTVAKSFQNPLKCFAYLLPPENSFVVGHVNTIGILRLIRQAQIINSIICTDAEIDESTLCLHRL